MPTPTYTPLANITLSTNPTVVTFSSISQSYKDLVIVIQGTKVSGTNTPYMRLNGDSGTTYYNVNMGGNGTSTASTYSATTTYIPLASLSWSTTIADSTVHIMDYSATDKQKSALVRANHADTGTEAICGRWANTAAVTSLTLNISTGWGTGTTFALYGIAA